MGNPAVPAGYRQMSLATVDVSGQNLREFSTQCDSSFSGSPGPLEQLNSVNPELRSECTLVFYDFYTN